MFLLRVRASDFRVGLLKKRCVFWFACCSCCLNLLDSTRLRLTSQPHDVALSQMTVFCSAMSQFEINAAARWFFGRSLKTNSSFAVFVHSVVFLLYKIAPDPHSAPYFCFYKTAHYSRLVQKPN